MSQGSEMGMAVLLQEGDKVRFVLGKIALLFSGRLAGIGLARKLRGQCGNC